MHTFSVVLLLSMHINFRASTMMKLILYSKNNKTNGVFFVSAIVFRIFLRNRCTHMVYRASRTNYIIHAFRIFPHKSLFLTKFIIFKFLYHSRFRSLEIFGFVI